jgi:hypothetical protein
MLRRFLAFLGPYVVRNLQDYYGGPLHRLEQAAAKKSEETLGFASAAERGRLDDGRQPPPVVKPQPRLTPAEERRRIEDRPVP